MKVDSLSLRRLIGSKFLSIAMFFAMFMHGTEGFCQFRPVPTSAITSSIAKIEASDDGYRLILSDGSTLKLLRSPEAKVEFQRLLPVEKAFVNSLGAGALASAASHVEDQFASSEATDTAERSLDQDPRVIRARRIGSFLIAMKDAIFISTFTAAKSFWQHSREHRKERVSEMGFEFAIRLDIQGGASKTAINQNIPLMFKISFDRSQREIVFRWGRRYESLSDGGVVNAGIRIETKAFILRGEDRRASKRGVGWYPPSIPLLAPVVDFGHGYSAVGLVFSAFNLSDYLVWTAFLNTVNEFNERQSRYSISLARLRKVETWLNWGERAWDGSLDRLEAAARANRIQSVQRDLSVTELQAIWRSDRDRTINEAVPMTRRCESLFLTPSHSFVD